MLKKAPLIASLIFAAIYTIISYRPGFLFNLTNFLFLVGVFHTAAGACVYVRNSGLFKSMAYTSYKRWFRKHPGADPTARPMSLAEYTLQIYGRRLPMKGYFLIGLPCLAVSYALLFLAGV